MAGNDSREAGHVYRVSSDNDVWVTFSFTERMDEADVLAHLVVEPAAKISTEWSNTGYRHSLRVHVFPSTESPLRIGLSAGARNVHGTRALGEDTMVTLERFPAPRVVMYLQKYSSMKMEEYGFYWASPEEAEVVMEFTKPMNKESLARALAGMVQPEEFKLTWLNDKKVILKFTPPVGGPKTYNLSLQGVKDQNGVLVSIPGQIELRVIPDVKVKSLNLATGQQAEVIVVSGGYEGGVVSPDGSRAVFWELGSSVGDSINYRYWLQDLTGGEKVLLTEGGKPKVKWFPGGDRVQVGNKVFSVDGRVLKNPLEEKHVIGFDLGPHGQLAYMSRHEPGENNPNVDLFYQWDGEWRVIEGYRGLQLPTIYRQRFPLVHGPGL
ncbi:hypothetical protein [Neomoorella thermoacetica]|uniref:hypothetical protein n=1 Tax=Neomoorella thermoacetica TaxID=1525 RepID=UPI00117EF316|nr:hypothetical protein [Moorella thermoacetica]